MMRIFLAIVCLVFSVAAHAKAVMVITPDAINPLQLSRTSSATIKYTVQNNTKNLRLNRFSIYPNFGTAPNAVSAISLTSNDCTYALAPGTSCTFQLQLTGNSKLPASFVVSPKVCAYSVGSSAAVCSQAVADDRVTVLVGNYKKLFAYIASSLDNKITQCEVLANGDFSSCTTSDFISPWGLVFNSSLTTTPTLAYISNINGNRVSICTFGINGALSCDSGADPGPDFFAQPSSMTINPSGTLLYVANLNDSKILVCNIDITNCQSTGSGFFYPLGIAINAAGTVVYVSNVLADTVSVCSVGVGGSLTCSPGINPGPDGFSRPEGITINAAGTFAYVVNNSIDSVLKCNIGAGGNLTSCTTAGSTGGNPRYLVFNKDESLAYITNSSDNNVSKCTVNASGDLVNCTTTGTNMFQPIGMQLAYF